MSWINEYIYLAEKYAVKNNDCHLDTTNITEKIIETPKTSVSMSMHMHIICYHIWNENKYPFIQFMLEKEENNLHFPFIEIHANTYQNIEKLITEKIYKGLEECTDHSLYIKKINYKGLINDSYEKVYALVDISDINIRHMHYTSSSLKKNNSQVIFALASEIINVGSVYDIKINQNIKDLFYDIPELGILHDPRTKKTYPLPDAIYSGSSLDNAIHSSFFGPSKKYIPTLKKSCYYFDTQFENAYLDGGWANDYFYVSSDVIDKNSRFQKYMKGGITRYALFPEDFSVLELKDDNPTIKITNSMLDMLNLHKQVYIVQRLTMIDNVKVIILVRDYDSFVPLSYCQINMQSIGDKYDVNKANNYRLL